MTALPLTPQDMAIQASELAALLTGAPESLTKTALEQLGLNQRTAYMRYGPAMQPASINHGPAGDEPGTPLPTPGGVAVRTKAATSIPSQSPAVSGETVPSQVEPSAGKTGPGVGDALVKDVADKAALQPPPAPKTTVDAEIKAIEAVCPHLSLSDSLFKRLKEVGVIKYPGTMSDRINCLRGLSVEQLRYIRTGVRQ